MVLRMTEEEYRAFQQRTKKRMELPCAGKPAAAGTPPNETLKRSKYGSRRTEAGGHRFDSRHEAEVYEELMLRVRSGELKTVLRQVGFDLPGGIRYFADFVTVDQENRITVIDAKSEATKKNRVYINKRKQVKALCGMEIQEV